MHDQGTAAVQRPEASSSACPDRAALLEQVQGLRAGIADMDASIDRLMVMRRRELAGLPAVRAREPELEAGA